APETAAPPRPIASPPPSIATPSPTAPPPSARVAAVPSAPAPAAQLAPSAAPPAPPTGDLATAWQRVVDDVMAKKPMLGTILAQAKPLGVASGELTLALTASQFQRDLLADRANREIVVQAIRRSVAG